MKKTKVKLIKIGHIDKVIDCNILKKRKSKLFELDEIDTINNLPEPLKDDLYLDVVYSLDELQSILSNTSNYDGICIALMNYRYDDNFYMHRINRNTVCISLADIEFILMRKEISLENFILKNIYEILALYKIFEFSLEGNVYEFTHSDTRGCLFDLNGDRNDIIYNTESPIICDECTSKINQKAMPENFLSNLNEELKDIKKPWIKSFEIFVKKYPIASILATIVLSTIINLFSTFLWEQFFKSP